MELCSLKFCVNWTMWSQNWFCCLDIIVGQILKFVWYYFCKNAWISQALHNLLFFFNGYARNNKITGTLVPNRIFVGGISSNTTESELLQLFSNYGTVKAAKIIQDRAGVSRGYGFITFESEDDAKRLQREADNITLRERKLNIAPAIKKQVCCTCQHWIM